MKNNKPPACYDPERTIDDKEREIEDLKGEIRILKQELQRKTANCKRWKARAEYYRKGGDSAALRHVLASDEKVQP